MRILDMDQSGLEAFSQEFLSIYLDNGFGSLSKADTEALIFFLLEKHCPAFAGMDEYDKSEFLRITDTKLRSLSISAYMRFKQKIDRNAIAEQVKEILTKAASESLYEGKQDIDIIALDERMKRELLKVFTKQKIPVDTSKDNKRISVNIEQMLSIFEESGALDKDCERLLVLIKAKEKIKDIASAVSSLVGLLFKKG